MYENSYIYHLSKIEHRNSRLDCLIQYSFAVKDLISSEHVDYFLNFYRFKSYLFINDYFPEKWDKHPDRVNKLLCKEENKLVNFKKITITCFWIFHEEISSQSIDAAFVVNGSLVTGEKVLQGINISRKLKLYWEILKPFAKTFNYRIVEVLKYNAIILIKIESKLTDEQIKKDYIEFKEG